MSQDFTVDDDDNNKNDDENNDGGDNDKYNDDAESISDAKYHLPRLQMKIKIVLILHCHDDHQVTRGLEERKATSAPRLPAALPLLSSPGGSRCVLIISIDNNVINILLMMMMMIREGSSREGSQGYGTISNCSSSDKESTAGSDSSR